MVAAAVTVAMAAPHGGPALQKPLECFILQRLDGSARTVSDADECRVGTSPASTFKIPHALIALETGVLSSAAETVRWDGTSHPFPAWERDHTLESAIRMSVVWFFRRTAGLIGAERMHDHLRSLRYAADTFEGDVTAFWLNSDLVVSPREQVDFLARMRHFELPVQRGHVEAVLSALAMRAGKIVNAAGLHDFDIGWPGPALVRAKTGFTTVGDERASWLVGYVESGSATWVFASRARSDDALAGTAGAELARRMLRRAVPAIPR